MVAHRGWPLRALHFELLWRSRDKKQGKMTPLCASILRLCAPTLKSLVWVSLEDKDV